MPLGPDASYSQASRIYTKQQPDGQTINGNTVITEQVNDVGSLTQQYGLQTFNGQILPGFIQFTVAPFGSGGSHQVQVTIQVVDNSGQPITGVPYDLDVILSDNANGVGVTAATMLSFNITAGTQLNQYIANKAFYVQTDATGKVVINFGITATPQIYVMVQAGQQPTPSIGSVPPASYS